MAKVRLEYIDVLPICPYCEKELETIQAIHKGIMSRTIIYICPHCRKVLSIGYDV
jgi:uncharacterized protein with PIN domain